MQVSAFHLMPYRFLPEDFEKRYPSAWFTLPFDEVADRAKVADCYNWTLDELAYAARRGFDGVCTNEHHQNAYGFMVNPNMMGSVLARETADLGTAIIQMGETMVFLNPPIRVAEEYAMLDQISRGRLVAGIPVGLGGDFAYSYGFAPMEQRERFREAHDLLVQAWSEPDPFAFNGKYYQLPMVNIWPRPLQQPRPPIWMPGTGSPSSWDFALANDYCYCFLTYFGVRAAELTVRGYWDRAEKNGRDHNPYRLGFLIPVGVAETDAEAERIYGPAIEYFYHKLLHLPDMLFFPPGHHDYQGLRYFMTQRPFPPSSEIKAMTAKDFLEQEFYVCGSAATVRERLTDIARRLRVGNLMIAPQFGNMTHEQAIANIDRLADDVLPALKPLWDDEGWVNHWWPQAATPRARAAA